MARKNIFGDEFHPMLYPNESVSYDVITKPYMVSYKMDGLRCVFKNGHMLSRSLKEIPNKQLQERFAQLKKMSIENNEIYDGELYSDDLTFQEITHFCMTDDLKSEELPESIKFYCFDFVKGEAINDENKTEIASIRYEHIEKMDKLNIPFFIAVNQTLIETPEEVENIFKIAVDSGFEGLIIKNPDSKYRYKRITSKSGDGYKYKPYRTYDAMIIGVEQATKVDPNAERKVNELGYHKTSQKKDDRILIDKASAFLVRLGDKTLKVTLAMTDEEKTEVWTDRDKYIGHWIEFKGMDVGAKDVPRHPVLLKFRQDLDDPFTPTTLKKSEAGTNKPDYRLDYEE